MLAIYTRLSREDSESSSIENQLREGKSFAKDNGFNDIKIYNEGEGVSGGADIKDRPKLFKLLQDINNDEVSAVWFRNQNRLERSSNTWHIFTTEAKKHNVEIYFNDKLFDFENPQDNLFGTITSALNQYQKDLQSAQTKRTLKDNASEGRVWSVVAYGYKSDNGFLAIDETEAEIVKEIYGLSLSGMGTRTIANRLNERGVPTRKNKIFRPHTVQSVIKNPLYKGKRIFSGEVFKSPAIVTSEYWQKVNDNLENNRTHSGKKVEYKYLLKGLLKCSKCGRNYYGRKRSNKRDNFYMCSSKRFSDLNCSSRGINIDILDSLIWHTVIKEGKLKEHIIEQHNKAVKGSSNTHLIAERDRLNKELLKVDKQLLNSFDLMTNADDLDDDTRALFSSKISMLQKTKKELKNELEVIEKELVVFDEMTKDIGKKLEGFDKIQNYKKLTHKLKKDSLDEVIESIQITDLKNNKHTLIHIVPKLGYEVEHLLLAINYNKDYATILTGDEPYLWNISGKGIEAYKKFNLGAIFSELQTIQEGWIKTSESKTSNHK